MLQEGSPGPLEGAGGWGCHPGAGRLSVQLSACLCLEFTVLPLPFHPRAARGLRGRWLASTSSLPDRHPGPCCGLHRCEN